MANIAWAKFILSLGAIITLGQNDLLMAVIRIQPAPNNVGLITPSLKVKGIIQTGNTIFNLDDWLFQERGRWQLRGFDGHLAYSHATNNAITHSTGCNRETDRLIYILTSDVNIYGVAFCLIQTSQLIVWRINPPHYSFAKAISTKRHRLSTYLHLCLMLTQPKVGRLI